MLRQTSSRNQRVRVFRPSHALQIIVLLIISVWLFYQTMHSHDKKAALEEGTSKMGESQFQILKLGRKDLPNTAQTMVSVDQIRPEGEDKDVGEVEQEKSDSGEEKETEKDVIDEPDQDRTDKKTEHGGGKFADEKEKDGLAEESASLDDQKHESSQEAREKTFKGDDASSAVAEGTKTAESESENGNPKNWDEGQPEILENKNTEAEITDDGSKDKSSSIGGAVNGSKSNDADVFLEDKKSVSNNSLIGNATEKRESEVVISKPELSVGSNDQTEMLTNATTVNVSSSQKEVQMNSPSAFASGSQVERQGSGIVVGTKTNGVTPRNETSTIGSLEVLNATMEIGSHGKDISNSEKLKQVGSSTDRLEQPEEMSSTTSNEKGDTTQGGSGDSSHDAVTKQGIGAHFDAPTLTNIQSKAKSSVSEAAE